MQLLSELPSCAKFVNVLSSLEWLFVWKRVHIHIGRKHPTNSNVDFTCLRWLRSHSGFVECRTDLNKMASATIANQVFSHHRLGASSRSRSGAESTSGSSSRSVLLKRTGLFALPSPADAQSPRHGRRKPQFRPAVSAGLAFLEPSTSIDMERLVAEAPSLLALSSDFDWQKSVSELRKEALGSLSAREERDIVLKQLGGVMDKWLHDSMLESVLQPAMVAGVQNPQEELRVRIRVEELRSQATLQVGMGHNGIASSFLEHAFCNQFVKYGEFQVIRNK